MKAKIVPLRAGRRAVGKFQAVLGEMFGKFFQAVHCKRQMREVGLDLDRFAAGEKTDFNLLLAAGRFEKNQFRAARRFVPARFFEAENVAVKFHRAFEIVHAIARVQ